VDFGKHQMPTFYFANQKKPVAQDANLKRSAIKKANKGQLLTNDKSIF
jgi:hypothetical protein